MSSFNHVEKISYNKVNEEPVSLIEYIVFTDDSHKEKYAILKLRNNLNQILSSIKINVYQYDENRVLLEKSLLVYGNFSAGSQEIFVPKAKLPLNYNAKSIEVNLEYARFERLVWENNDLNVVPYTRKEFKEYTTENEKVKKAIIKEEKRSKGKRSITANDIIRRNVPRGPIIFTRILSVLLFAFIIFGAITSKNFTYSFSYEGFDYEKNGNELSIVKYTGEDESVVIPNKVSGMKIVEIATGAFEDSEIQSIQFNSKDLVIRSKAFKNCVYLENIYDNNSISIIEQNAFENCYSLKTLSLPSCISIYGEAFKNCYSLNYVDVSNAGIEKNAFLGCININSFYYNYSNASYFLEMFSTTTSVGRYPMDVVSNQLKVRKDFFKGCYGFSNLTFTNNSFSTEYGALQDLNLPSYIQITGTNVNYEKYNGNIISYDLQSNTLLLDDQYSNVDINAILASINCNLIYELIVDTSNVVVNDTFISRFGSLNKLELTSKADVQINDYLNVPTTISEMILDSSVKGFANLVGSLSENATLRIKGDKGIDGLMLQKAVKVREIVIEDTIPSVAENAFRNCVLLSELTIPTLSGYTLRQLGVNTSLTRLTVTKTNTFAKGAFEGYTLTYLEINLGNNSSTMQQLFGITENVNTLVVSANTINEYFLTGMNVKNFAIKSTNMVYGTFADSMEVKVQNLFICDNITIDMINYGTLSKSVVNVYFEGEGEYVPNCSTNYSVSFETFISRVN